MLMVDPQRLKHAVKFEPAAPVGATAAHTVGERAGEVGEPLFPHLYGPLNVSAVTGEAKVERDEASGAFLRILWPL